MTSYQKLKKKLALLNRHIFYLEKKAEFFQKAIWNARKLTGERLGIEPFSHIEGDEECLTIRNVEGLTSIIRELPLTYGGNYDNVN